MLRIANAQFRIHLLFSVLSPARGKRHASVEGEIDGSRYNAVSWRGRRRPELVPIDRRRCPEQGKVLKVIGAQHLGRGVLAVEDDVDGRLVCAASAAVMMRSSLAKRGLCRYTRRRVPSRQDGPPLV